MKWETRPFEECLQVVKTPFKLPKKQYKDEGRFPVVSQEAALISGYHDDENNLFKVDAPVVIFGDHTQVLKYIDFDFVLGADGVKIFSPVPELNSKFFFYSLQAIMPSSTGYARHYKFLKKLNLSFPPLSEQKKIVNHLDAVYSLIEEQNKVMAKEILLAKQLAGSILTAKLKHVAGAKTTTLKEIAALNGRIGWKGLTAKEYVAEGPRFLSVHSLNHGHYVDFGDAFNITQERYDESPEIMLQKDDILICKDGNIGKVGMVPELLGPTTINSSLLLIRSSPEVFHEYLYFYLLSPMFQSIVQERLSGSTIPHLYQRDIAELTVLLPPLETQRLLVAQIWDAFERQENLLSLAQRKLELLESLRKAFLAKSLVGAAQ